MTDKTVIKEFLSAGKRLTLLQGKKPYIDNWVEAQIPDKKIYDHKGNIGWVIGAGDLVIDIDPKNGGNESFVKLMGLVKNKQEGFALAPTVLTPSGGFHVYLKIKPTKGLRLKKTLNNDYPGIDFLYAGAQCVIPTGTVGERQYKWVDDMFGFIQNDCPKVILDLVSYIVKDEGKDDDPDDFVGDIGSSSTWPKGKVLAMLGKIDPSLGNDEWVKVGMALHDWDTVEGLEVWENWSKDGDNWVEDETGKRWRSFELGGGVTLGTVSYMARKVDYKESVKVVDDYINRIKLAGVEQLEFEIIPKLKKVDIDKLNRSIIGKCIQSRLKELKNVSVAIGDIRQAIAPTTSTLTEIVSSDEKPKWCKNWVYVNSHAGWMSLDNLKLHKTESFNVENGKYIPSDMGKKMTAMKYVADKGFVNKVDLLMYLPTFDGRICQIDGSIILNSFNHKTIPEEAMEYTEGGLKVIEQIKGHLKFICGNEEDAEILFSWLAHQVQFPGKQVLWSPVIQSIQGLGKTFFSELLRSAMGDVNVGVVNPVQVTSPFNSWATNVCVNVLEELRLVGHNRYDVVNTLKPLITDRMIQINEKGVKQYTTYNTTNYLCFTNYKDAIPMTEDDRRWWIIFVQAQSMVEAGRMLGESHLTYFPRLFEGIKQHGPELRKWFLGHKLSAKFLNTKQAPLTAHKQSMIATEELSLEGLVEVKEMIAKGGKYYNVDVVCSGDLFDDLMFEYPELVVQTSKRNVILKQLGYNLVSNVIKVDGKTRRVWTRKQLNNDEIRIALEDL